MHQKTRRFQIYIFTFMLFLAFLTRAHAGAPLDLVRTTVDRAIQILKDPKLSSRDKKNERVDRLREALDAIFDYEEMAKRALGPHWRQRTPAEQQEFVKLFHYFLERVYSIRSISMAVKRCASAARSWITNLRRLNQRLFSPKARRSPSFTSCGK